MNRDGLYTVDFETFSTDKKQKKKFEYEYYDQNNKLVLEGKVSTDDEEIIDKSNSNIDIFDMSTNEAMKFINDYPLLSRPYFNIFMIRDVKKLPTISYQLPPVQDDFYLNILDWSKNNLIGAACTSKLLLIDPEYSKEDENPNCSQDFNINSDLMQMSQSKSKLKSFELTKNSSNQSKKSLKKSNSIVDYTSCNFSPDGSLLAAGTVTGDIEVWDLNTEKISTKLTGHIQRVGVLDWVPSEAGLLLTSGSRDKSICIHDLRSFTTAGELVKHKQEVCGLSWKPSICDTINCNTGTSTNQISDEDPIENDDQENEKLYDLNDINAKLQKEYEDATYRRRCSFEDSKRNVYQILQDCCHFNSNFQRSVPLLASGGNDNRVYIWELGYTTPVTRLVEHSAAVKAISWAPLNYPILATGGGTNDRSIRLWDTLRKKEISCCESESQVCNIYWTPASLELISSHGYTLNQVNVWDITKRLNNNRKIRLRKLSTFSGHTTRALYMCASPDGRKIATAAGEGILRIWEPFM